MELFSGGQNDRSDATIAYQYSQTQSQTVRVENLLALVALSIVFLIEIDFASASPGTAPGDLVSMTVFP
jgi:hypothetical protein